MLPRNDTYHVGSHEVRSLPRSPENMMQSNGMRHSDVYMSSTAPLHSRYGWLSHIEAILLHGVHTFGFCVKRAKKTFIFMIS